MALAVSEAAAGKGQGDELLCGAARAECKRMVQHADPTDAVGVGACDVRELIPEVRRRVSELGNGVCID